MRPSRVVRGIRNRAAARERLPRAWRKASSIRLRSCCASASRRPPTAALFIERGLAAHGLGAVVGERHLIQQCAALPVQQQAAPDHVFQLPDVARPVAGQQLRQRPFAKGGDTWVEAARIATDERPCQQFHIAGALAQRDVQAAHVQAVVQVLAQASLGDRLARRLVARRDQAYVGPLRAQAAQRQVAAVLQDPQQLALHGHRHGIDLVEEQAAALRQGEHALRFSAPVKAPRVVPNRVLSSSVSGIAAQFRLIIGPLRRGLRAWARRANSSLPVPVSPWISSGRSVAAKTSRRCNCRSRLGATLRMFGQSAGPAASSVSATTSPSSIAPSRQPSRPRSGIARWRYCNSSPPAPRRPAAYRSTAALRPGNATACFARPPARERSATGACPAPAAGRDHRAGRWHGCSRRSDRRVDHRDRLPQAVENRRQAVHQPGQFTASRGNRRLLDKRHALPSVSRMSKSRQLSHLRRSATEHPWRGSTKPSENQENPPIYQGFPRQFPGVGWRVACNDLVVPTRGKSSCSSTSSLARPPAAWSTA